MTTLEKIKNNGFVDGMKELLTTINQASAKAGTTTQSTTDTLSLAAGSTLGVMAGGSILCVTISTPGTAGLYALAGAAVGLGVCSFAGAIFVAGVTLLNLKKLYITKSAKLLAGFVTAAALTVAGLEHTTYRSFNYSGSKIQEAEKIRMQYNQSSCKKEDIKVEGNKVTLPKNCELKV